MQTKAEVQVLRVYTCPACGISYGIPAGFDTARREDGKTFYCPNRDPLSYRESEVARLREEAERAKTREKWAREMEATARRRAEHQERRAAAFKGHVTRIKNRVGKGVCPCCNRTFQNLGRHMESQHPDWAPDTEPK